MLLRLTLFLRRFVTVSIPYGLKTLFTARPSLISPRNRCDELAKKEIAQFKVCLSTNIYRCNAIRWLWLERLKHMAPAIDSVWLGWTISTNFHPPSNRPFKWMKRRPNRSPSEMSAANGKAPQPFDFMSWLFAASTHFNINILFATLCLLLRSAPSYANGPARFGIQFA